MQKRLSFKKIIISLCLIAASVSVFYVYYNYYNKNINSTIIDDYKSERDREFFIKLFNKHKYWLYGDGVECEPAFTLDNMSSSRSPANKGNLIVKVQLEDGKPVGLVGYFLQKLYEAQILYLVVDEKYRKKGYAKKLMQYALEDLKRRGQHMAWLLTRMGNTSARNLYEGLGFHEFWHNDKYIKYKKYLN